MADICVLCGMPSPTQHPWVGIGRTDLTNNTGEMTKHSVCHPCFIDPTHRTVQKAKLHFHARANAAPAVSAARDLDALSKSGKDLDL